MSARRAKGDALIDLLYLALPGETSCQCFRAFLVAELPGGKSTLLYYDHAVVQGAVNLNVDMDDGVARISFEH